MAGLRLAACVQAFADPVSAARVWKAASSEGLQHLLTSAASDLLAVAAAAAAVAERPCHVFSQAMQLLPPEKARGWLPVECFAAQRQRLPAERCLEQWLEGCQEVPWLPERCPAEAEGCPARDSSGRVAAAAAAWRTTSAYDGLFHPKVKHTETAETLVSLATAVALSAGAGAGAAFHSDSGCGSPVSGAGAGAGAAAAKAMSTRAVAAAAAALAAKRLDQQAVCGRSAQDLPPRRLDSLGFQGCSRKILRLRFCACCQRWRYQSGR